MSSFEIPESLNEKFKKIKELEKKIANAIRKKKERLKKSILSAKIHDYMKIKLLVVHSVYKIQTQEIRDIHENFLCNSISKFRENIDKFLIKDDKYKRLSMDPRSGIEDCEDRYQTYYMTQVLDNCFRYCEVFHYPFNEDYMKDMFDSICSEILDWMVNKEMIGFKLDW